MSSSANLEKIYDEHAAALFGFLLNLTRNEADTFDLVQELFCRIAARPVLLNGVKEMRAFLIRMAHNLAIDLMRRNSTRGRNHDRLGAETEVIFAAAPNADVESLRRELSRAMGQLPPEQRAVMHLKLWEGLPFETTAETLEIPANTAASRYRYALDKLRELLRPLYDEIK
jgi:RNA polymerase sigma-70 factor (ECF subfamily)